MSGETKTPVLRFPDSAPWKDQRLGAFGKPFNGLNGKTKADFGHGEGRYVTYLGIFTNAIVNRGHCASVEIDSSQNIVRKGDVFFTTSSETPDEVGMSAVWMDEVPNTYLNSFCFGFRPDGNNDSEFLAYLFRSPVFRNNMAFLAQGISRYNISKGKVMDIMVSLPSSTSEQRRIGGFFRELDALIAEREKALGKLESLKKAMLEKMFPQGDAKVPEVRFKGFEGEWEEKKFETAASRKSSLCDDLDLPRLEYEDVVSFCGVLNKNIFQKQSTKTGIPFSTGNVLFGKLRPYLGNWFLPEFDGLAVGDWWVLQPKTLDPAFLFSFIQTNSFQKIANQSTGSKMPRADWNLVSNSVFLFPSLPEQQEIGSFFRSLDALLASRREEAEKLKQLKKAFLERMFA